MSIAISYTPEKCQHHLIALTTVFLLLELLGELLIACLWGDLSHHHCFTKLKKKKKKKPVLQNHDL